MKRLFEYGFYPFVLLSSTLLTAWLLSVGAPHTAVALGMPLLYGLLCVAAEAIAPEYPGWIVGWRAHGVDLLHAVFSNVLPGAIGKLGVLWLALHAPTLDRVWAPLPYPIQLVLALVAADLVFYWCHRLLHTIPAIWRWHAIHHRSEQMYSLAALTNHPGQVIVAYTLEVAFLVALGVPDDILVAQGVYKTVHGLVQHSNLPLRCGVFNLFLSTPELHRWHHHREIRESNANYGNTTALWDHVFGSRNHEWERPMPRTLGLPPEIRIGDTFVDQLLAPLQWTQRFPAAPRGWWPIYPTTRQGFLDAERRAARGE